MRLQKLLLAGASLLALALVLEPAPAHAVCPGTIVNGETQAVTQNLANDENCTVDTGGTINTVGVNADGIAANNNNSITNSGNISTTGNNAEAIRANDNSTITNSGSISTAGTSAEGILARYTNTITNSGSISTTDSDSKGIEMQSNNRITNSGSIFTAGINAEGIQATDNNSIINNGSISTTDSDSEGIQVNNNNSITNSGNISTAGNAAEGILATDNNTITNSGSISTTDSDSEGIQVNNNSSITNSGNISTAGNAAEGILANDNSAITNSGSISTTDSDSEGIQANNNNSITNSGSIFTAGINAEGIQANDSNSITNSGSISTVGTNADSIRADDNNTITNSGLISATGAGSNAIRFTGNANTLTLNPGSAIIGPLNFVQATNTLSLGNGLSIANTFTGNLPGTINANGAPSAVSGLQVAVVDPTNLAAQDELLVDLTGGIFGTVQNRLGGLRNGVAGVTSNPRPMSIGGTSKMGAMVEDTSRQGWAQAFGSYRLQREDGPNVDADIRLGGLVSGFDEIIGGGTRLGVFFGGSQAEVEADFNSQDTDVDSLFGGFYASTLRGSTAIDFALTVGYSDYDRERRVANNTVATSIQTARADYDGWFVSPELTLTRPLWAGEQRYEKSLTLRYSGLFLDGFTETGAADALTVNDRDIHVLQARTQLTMPVEHHGPDGSSLRSAFYIGLEGRAQVGDEDVTGTLLAQNITFNPGGDDVVGGAFAGLEFERTSAGGTTFFASIEGQVETGGGRQASGKAGIRFRF